MALFLAGFLARYVAPDRFWWFQLAGIAFPFLALALVPATLVVLQQKAWRLLVVHGFMLVLAASRFVSFGEASASAADSEALRYMSYNIGHPEKDAPANRTRQMRQLLRTAHADLIGFQEFVVRYRQRVPEIQNLPRVSALFDSLEYEAIGSEVNEVGTTFLPVIAYAPNVRLLRQEKHRINLNNQPEFSVQRVEFEWMGRTAALYNVHLRTFGSRKPWEEEDASLLNWRLWTRYMRQYRHAFQMRAWEAAEIRKLVENETGPVVLSGDFNSTQHNYAYQVLAGPMRDAFRVAGGLWGATFPANFPLVRIDHVLVSPEWNVVDARVLEIEGSDHRPTQVVLTWVGR